MIAIISNVQGISWQQGASCMRDNFIRLTRKIMQIASNAIAAYKEQWPTFWKYSLAILGSSSIACTIFWVFSEKKKIAKIHQSNQKIASFLQTRNYQEALRVARSMRDELQEKGPQAQELDEICLQLETLVLQVGFSKRLFDTRYRPRASLVALLQRAGMKNPKEIHQINEWAQQNLLRKKQRWDPQDEEKIARFAQIKSAIQPHLVELGFIEAIKPSFQTYEGALIHGATLSTVRQRIAYLVAQWQQGTRFATLYFLTGERVLEPKEMEEIRGKNPPSSTSFLKTERDMIEMVWNQSEIPETMRTQLHVRFINTPMKKDLEQDKWLRPTTDDTVHRWMETAPPYGRYLAVSNAPYIVRQDLVVRAIASAGYSFDTIGYAASQNEKTFLLLDEVARTIFQMDRQAEKANSCERGDSNPQEVTLTTTSR